MKLALRSLVAVAFLLSGPSEAQPDCSRTLVFMTVRPSSTPSQVPGPQRPSRLDPALTPAVFHNLYASYFAPAGRTVIGGGKAEYSVTGVAEVGQPYCFGAGLGFLAGGNNGQSCAGQLYPVCWHGTKVSTFDACGANRESFGPGISGWLGGMGGIKQALARYEQIPVSVKGTLDGKCVEPGAVAGFDLTELKAAVAPLGATDAKPRLVVRAEDGFVENGEKGPTPDEKVFVIDSVGATVKLQYRAPGERKRSADVLHVWNSCDVGAPFFTPYQSTAKKDELAAFEVPICESYRLEYQYDVKINAEGANLDYRVRGEVPFTIKDKRGQTQFDRNGRPKNTRLSIEGSATLGATLKGREGECTLTASKKFDVKLSGEVRLDREWTLYIDIEEDHRAPLTMTLICPDEDPVTLSRPMPVPMLQYKRIELPDQEGKSVEGPFQGSGGSGTYKIILHTSSGT